jgi:hypothetical protein
VPAAQPGKLSIMIEASRYAGDPNRPNPVTGYWLAGTAAGCLKATNDGSGPDATAVNTLNGAFVVVDPGTAAIGFWHVADLNVGRGTCAGAPAFSVPLPSLAAGSRTALFVYGPTVTTSPASWCRWTPSLASPHTPEP